MASNSPNAVRQFLHGIFARQRTAESPDGLLLQRFAAQGDEDAFAALVKRHGPMVLGVCERLLNDSHDAEDAFQATFLILARRAGSVGNPDLLAHWLYGVAYRVGVRARGARAKRRGRERQVTDVPAQEPTPEMIWSDLRPVLDEEVNRLPAKYRAPFVLCYLEGKTNEEAAALLGCPKGTVLSRLATARQRLRSRLTRRGITLSAGLLAAALSRHASAAVPPSLVALALRAAATVATGPAAGGAVSATVLALAEGVQKAMFWSKVRTTGVLLVATAALAGTLLLPGLLPSTARPQAAAGPPQSTPPPAGNAGPAAPPAVTRGSNYLVYPVTTELQRALPLWHGDARTLTAWVLIDGMSVVRPDGLVDSKALDFDGLLTALKPYRGKGHGLYVQVFFSSSAPEDGARVLRWALEGFGRQAGFDTAQAMSTWFNGPYDWKAKTAVAGPEGRADAEEPATGNDLVRVYPVRTALSRQLTHADCVVDIVPPLEGQGDGLKPGVREAIGLYVERLKLPRKDKVLFRVHRSNDEAAARFVATTAEELAKSLGFKSSSIED